jgi:hypothetical protein
MVGWVNYTKKERQAAVLTEKLSGHKRGLVELRILWICGYIAAEIFSLNEGSALQRRYRRQVSMVMRCTRRDTDRRIRK